MPLELTLEEFAERLALSYAAQDELIDASRGAVARKVDDLMRPRHGLRSHATLLCDLAEWLRFPARWAGPGAIEDLSGRLEGLWAETRVLSEPHDVLSVVRERLRAAWEGWA